MTWPPFTVMAEFKCCLCAPERLKSLAALSWTSSWQARQASLTAVPVKLPHGAVSALFLWQAFEQAAVPKSYVSPTLLKFCLPVAECPVIETKPLLCVTVGALSGGAAWQYAQLPLLAPIFP